MAKRKHRMPTLWEVPDGLWERVQPLVERADPAQPTGRKRVDRRRVLDGIIFRMRTGCQWNHIPRVYGSDRTIHRYFQHWGHVGLFEKIWALIVEECDDLKAVQWDWQAADTTLGKARLGGAIGPNPTDRAKNGTKRSVLTDGAGGPLAVVVAPANVHDTKLLKVTLEAIIVERPKPTRRRRAPEGCRGYPARASTTRQ